MMHKILVGQIFRVNPPGHCALNPDQLSRRHHVVNLLDEEPIVEELTDEDVEVQQRLRLQDGKGLLTDEDVEALRAAKVYRFVEATQTLTFKIGEIFYHDDPIPKGLLLKILDEDDDDDEDEEPEDDDDVVLLSSSDLENMSFDELKHYGANFDITDRSKKRLIEELIEAGKVVEPDEDPDDDDPKDE